VEVSEGSQRLVSGIGSPDRPESGTRHACGVSDARVAQSAPLTRIHVGASPKMRSHCKTGNATLSQAWRYCLFCFGMQWRVVSRLRDLSYRPRTKKSDKEAKVARTNVREGG
jgi:hypothetical protein